MVSDETNRPAPVEFIFSWASFEMRDVASLLAASAVAHHRHPILLVKALIRSMAENLIARVDDIATEPLRITMESLSRDELIEGVVAVSIVRSHLNNNRAARQFFDALSEACSAELTFRED